MPPSSYYRAPSVHDPTSQRGSPAYHRAYPGFRESLGSFHALQDFPSAPLYFFYPGFNPQAFNPGIRSGYNYHPGSTQGYHLGHLSGPQIYSGPSHGYSFVPSSGLSQQRLETPQTNEEKLVLFVRDENAKVKSGETSKNSQEFQVVTMRVHSDPTANTADRTAMTKIDAKRGDGDGQSDSSEKIAMEDGEGKKEDGKAKM